jgi:hypothetical protein
MDQEDLNKIAAGKIKELIEVLANGRRISSESLQEAFDIVEVLENANRNQHEEEIVHSDTLAEGDLVEDEDPRSFVDIAGLPNLFKVVEITDEKSDECIINPEDDEFAKSVSDENPAYPNDDQVVKVRPIDRDTIYKYPISRLNKLAGVEGTTN